MANNLLLESGSTTLIESGSALQLESGIATAVSIPVQPIRRSLRVLPRRAAGRGSALPAAVGTPVPAARRAPRSLFRARSRTQPAPPAPPVVPVNPAIPFQTARRAARMLPPRLVRGAKVLIHAAGTPMVRQPVQERHHRAVPRRKASVVLLPAQLAPPIPRLAVRRKFLRSSRPRITFRVPATPNAPTTACSLTLVNGTSYLLLSNSLDHLSLAVCANPVFVISRLRRRLARPPAVRRPRPDIVLTQAAPVNPALTFTQPQRRGLRAALRRGKPVTVVQAQAAAPNPALVFARPPRRAVGSLRVRRRPIERTPAQVILTNPVMAPTGLRRRIVAAILRRGRQLTGPLPARPTIIFPLSGVIGGSSTHGTVPDSATKGTVPESGLRGVVPNSSTTGTVPESGGRGTML